MIPYDEPIYGFSGEKVSTRGYIDLLMSPNFCPHLIFKFGDLIEFFVLKD